MIDKLEHYMDQFMIATQPDSTPSTHAEKAIQRINHLNYILHAWVPEVRVKCTSVNTVNVLAFKYRMLKEAVLAVAFRNLSIVLNLLCLPFPYCFLGVSY